MADSYSAGLGAPTPAFNDPNWNAENDRYHALLEAQNASGGYFAVHCVEGDVPESVSLNVKVGAGSFRNSLGQVVTYAGIASQAMTTGQTNSIYLDDAGALHVSTTGFPANTLHVPIAIVVAGASTITSITDARKPFHSLGADPLIFTATAPTPTAGGGAGTGPTITVSGSHRAGTISVTTGTGPSASTAIVTMTFAAAFASAPRAVIIAPANAVTAALSGAGKAVALASDISTTLFKLTSGSTPLAATTAYQWYYWVFG